MVPELECFPPNQWHSDWLACIPNPCPQPPPPPLLGACCLGEVCTMRTMEDCVAQGGIWTGSPTCDPNPCLFPTPVERSSWGRIKASYR